MQLIDCYAIGHWALGIGHGALGIGHGALGMGHGALVTNYPLSLPHLPHLPYSLLPFKAAII